MDRGIGMDAFITAGHPDIGDGAITIDTGITATTTVDIGIAVTEESITLNVRQGFAARGATRGEATSSYWSPTL